MSSCFDALKNKINNKTCAVLGFGVSNIPLVKVLIDLGVSAGITVYDKKSELLIKRSIVKE